MKIKTWFVWIIVGTVSLFFLVQVCFYFMFRNWNNSMRDSLIETTANQSASQIAEQYNSVEDVSVNIMTDAYVQDYLFNAETHTYENYNHITNNITSIIFANKGIQYVAILNESNIILNVSQAGNMLEHLSLLEQVKQDIAQSEWQGAFVKAYQHSEKNCFAYVDCIRSLTFDNARHRPRYIVILFEVSELESALEPVFDQNKFTLRILDHHDRILRSGSSNEFGQIFTPADHAPDSWYKIVTMDQPEWKLCFSIPKVYFGSSQSSFLVFMLLVVVLNGLLLIFMIKILIQNISESISDIEKEIGIIYGGKWEHRIRCKKENEIGSIAQNFNTLLDKYEEMMRKNSAMEEEIHTARLLQLQAQIDQLQEKISPHFLYNSMEYIKGVAQEHGVEKIADITSVLSQNFRYNMDAAREVSVKEDLFYALSYFNVVNSRRKHPIRLNLNLSKDIMERRIIKMVFQPILENTLKHGDLDENGVVDFSGRIRDDGFTEISVKDNGRGIPDETYEKLQASLRDDVNYVKDEKGDHQGILNVHTRLKLTYGDGCGISIKSKFGECTEIIITFKQKN
ncbi:MAG: histidine kinase [Clostridia bacterium]|nr:histidine kinase [Clostridia bacterium]